MVNILSYIAEQLESIGISYEYGEWTQEVNYPYFVGTFLENENRYEDGYTGGVLTIDGWARGSGGKLQLAEANDKIKDLFYDNRAVCDGYAFFVNYGSTLNAPTGEEDLYKITISLNTNEWKGDN